MFPTPKKLLSSKDIIGYTLPRLHTGKDWYVDFYVYDPTIDGLKRKKYMLNKPKSSLGFLFAVRHREILMTDLGLTLY